MATTPGSRRREPRAETGAEDRDTLNPMQEPLMQEPLGSINRPTPRSDRNEANLGAGDTMRRSAGAGTASSQPTSTTARGGRSFITTIAIAAVVLLVAFLIALSLGNDRRETATGTGNQAPVADSNTGTSGDDTTGSTTPPAQQTAPGTGDAGGTAQPPANP